MVFKGKRSVRSLQIYSSIIFKRWLQLIIKYYNNSNNTNNVIITIFNYICSYIILAQGFHSPLYPVDTPLRTEKESSKGKREQVCGTVDLQLMHISLVSNVISEGFLESITEEFMRRNL